MSEDTATNSGSSVPAAGRTGPVTPEVTQWAAASAGAEQATAPSPITASPAGLRHRPARSLTQGFARQIHGAGRVEQRDRCGGIICLDCADFLFQLQVAGRLLGGQRAHRPVVESAPRLRLPFVRGDDLVGECPRVQIGTRRIGRKYPFQRNDATAVGLV